MNAEKNARPQGARAAFMFPPGTASLQAGTASSALHDAQAHLLCVLQPVTVCFRSVLQLLEVVAEIDRRRDPWLPPLLNVTYPLEHSNQGRRAKCSADGKPEPRQLQPRPVRLCVGVP